MIKSIVILIAASFFSCFIYAQEIVYPNRIGLKLGKPLIFGLDYEHNLKNHKRISLNSSVFYFKYDNNGAYTESFNINFGTYFYLIKDSKGLYMGLDLGYHNFINRVTGIIITDEENNIDYFNGERTIKFNSLVINPKLGYRIVKGHFTISPDIGFNIYRYLKYNYEEKDEGYSNIEDIDDLNSKIGFGTITLYISIGYAF